MSLDEIARAQLQAELAELRKERAALSDERESVPPPHADRLTMISEQLKGLRIAEGQMLVALDDED